MAMAALMRSAIRQRVFIGHSLTTIRLPENYACAGSKLKALFGERYAVLSAKNVERAFFSRSGFREKCGPNASVHQDEISVSHSSLLVFTRLKSGRSIGGGQAKPFGLAGERATGRPLPMATIGPL